MQNKNEQAQIWGSISGQKRKEHTQKQYVENPCFCLYCTTKLPYEKRHNKFCDKSCSAKYNNQNICRNPNGNNGLISDKHYCSICHISIAAKNGKYAKYCADCSPRTDWDVLKTRFIHQGFISASAESTCARYIRKFLFETEEHKCKICGIREWQNQPIPLVADHINGDPHDHHIVNLRLICNNCDSLLPTYKSKNWGKGRNYRYKK